MGPINAILAAPEREKKTLRGRLPLISWEEDEGGLGYVHWGGRLRRVEKGKRERKGAGGGVYKMGVNNKKGSNTLRGEERERTI